MGPSSSSLKRHDTDVRASVIIPVGQIHRFLAESVESVIADCPDSIEIVVVNDGNHESVVIEALGAVAERVSVVHQHRQGAGVGRNAGVRASSGQVLMFLDADDLWLPGRFLAQMKLLHEQPEAIHCGYIEEFLDPTTDWGEVPAPRIRLLEGPSIITTACLRTVFDRIGPFRHDLETAEYIEWSLRAQRSGTKTVMNPVVWARRRVHAWNRDRTSRSGSADYLRVIREHRTALTRIEESNT